MISITVKDILQDSKHKLQLKIFTGTSGVQKKIFIPQIQKPGLALTGYTSNLHPGRVQVLGNSEIDYLEHLPHQKIKKIAQQICQVDIACFVVANHKKPPEALRQECEKKKIPILLTPLPTSTLIQRLTRCLEEKLTETTTIHGVLLDVFGVGTLLTGKSGIGKSECALEMIMKGHRLVADDMILISKKPPNRLYGSGSDLLKYHMEIRGLGIINIKDLFGVAAVRDQKMIELVIEMVEWNQKEEYERVGIDQKFHEILGIELPFVKLPVRSGRSLTSIIEVASRNHLLKLKGYYSAQEFQDKLTQELLWNQKGKEKKKIGRIIR